MDTGKKKEPAFQTEVKTSEREMAQIWLFTAPTFSLKGTEKPEEGTRRAVFTGPHPPRGSSSSQGSSKQKRRKTLAKKDAGTWLPPPPPSKTDSRKRKMGDTFSPTRVEMSSIKKALLF